ncbi:hypothetical protein C8R45DRAFT_1079332 [Mycena sanguinolenta]|nr:hypothetical protein C8R45DRAFT_1079332 [Mycena sanguinolenta]
MRKKDRRNHKPHLKWTSSHANRQYLPFFWVLTYLALSLVAFGLSPNIHSTIKLLAAEIGTQIETVTAAFSQLRANQLPLYCAVEELTKMAKSKDSDTAPAPSAGAGAVLSEDVAIEDSRYADGSGLSAGPIRGADGHWSRRGSDHLFRQFLADDSLSQLSLRNIQQEVEEG